MLASIWDDRLILIIAKINIYIKKCIRSAHLVGLTYRQTLVFAKMSFLQLSEECKKYVFHYFQDPCADVVTNKLCKNLSKYQNDFKVVRLLVTTNVESRIFEVFLRNGTVSAQQQRRATPPPRDELLWITWSHEISIFGFRNGLRKYNSKILSSIVRGV